MRNLFCNTISDPQIVGHVNSRYAALPEFPTCLPLHFDNGSTMVGLSVICKGCHESITGESVHGEVRHPINGVYTLSGYAYCPECNLLTHFAAKAFAAGEGHRIEQLPLGPYQKPAEASNVVPLWSR